MVLRLKRQKVGRLLIFYTYGRGLSFFFKVGNIENAIPIEIFGIINRLTTMIAAGDRGGDKGSFFEAGDVVVEVAYYYFIDIVKPRVLKK